MPIHGEYRYLAQHARIAEAAAEGGTRVLVVEDGHRIGFDTETGWIRDTVPAGRVLLDGTRNSEVVDEVLRDRRHLARTRWVVCQTTSMRRCSISCG